MALVFIFQKIIKYLIQIYKLSYPKGILSKKNTYLPFFYDMGNFKNMTLLVSHKYMDSYFVCN